MNRYRRARLDRLADVRFMADNGESLSGAAARLGLKANTLEAWARRNAPAAYLKLRAREPHDPNQRPGMRAMTTRRADA